VLAPFATLRDLHLDALMVSIQCWRHWWASAAHETVEMVEALPARPPVERPGDRISQSGTLWFLPNQAPRCSRSGARLRDHGRAGRNLPAVAGTRCPFR